VNRLKGYSFAEPDHAILLRALGMISVSEQAEIREALARASTKLGFPDIDLETLFSETPPTRDRLLADLESL
jgi:hypothetical protein